MEMAETSTMNSDNKVEQSGEKEKVEVECLKAEVSVTVKREMFECVTCMSRSHECVDIYTTETAAARHKLHEFLHKFTHVDLSTQHNASKYMCRTCNDLVNVFEQAEIDYFKLKDAFVTILKKNPLFDAEVAQPIQLTSVKAEFISNEDDDGVFDTNDEDYVCDNAGDDSDDEPLATQSKRKRHNGVKKKKKSTPITNKRKARVRGGSTSWKCDECGASGVTGGDIALAAHKLAVHTIEDPTLLTNVKIEDSAEGSRYFDPVTRARSRMNRVEISGAQNKRTCSQSPFNNGFSSCLKVEVENFDDENSLGVDDTSNDAAPVNKMVKRSKNKLVTKQVKKKKTKVLHQCDQCDAKYTSLSRLEQHKQKHDGSKPPYICEVCGAHYKHKRACDIHIALHKGISDWKCEECNKLFPSKNALQRHNNIHTGKLNYQCDLCGKSFIHTSSFKMHKLSHSGVKPHSCDVCGLALMTRSHLKRHKRVHSGEKRHECQVCGKRFSERYNLAAHSKSHETAEGQAATPAPRRRLFRCTFCPERFERRYMLERHVSVVHGRTLERPPPTPRNTMSKLLKAQAQGRTSNNTTAPSEADTKDERSSDSRTTPITPQKLLAQLSASTSIVAQGAWGGGYTAEFLRHEYPH